MTHYNHSAGPWDFVAEPGQMVLVYSGNDETMIAEVNALYDNDAETLANARLIAAAPSMLDALRDCFEYLDGIPESATGGDDDAVNLASRARKALDLATGKYAKER